MLLFSALFYRRLDLQKASVCKICCRLSNNILIFNVCVCVFFNCYWANFGFLKHLSILIIAHIKPDKHQYTGIGVVGMFGRADWHLAQSITVHSFTELHSVVVPLSSFSKEYIHLINCFKDIVVQWEADTGKYAPLMNRQHASLAPDNSRIFLCLYTSLHVIISYY